MPLHGLQELQTLALDNTMVYGTLPASWPTALPHLRELSLRRNDILGTFPSGKELYTKSAFNVWPQWQGPTMTHQTW